MVGGGLEEEVSKLKEQCNEDVAVHRSGQLARSVFDVGLVERVPVDDLPGRDRRGQAPLRRHRMRALELADLTAVGDDGVIVQIYTSRM